MEPELSHRIRQEQAYVSLYPSTHGYFLSVSFPQSMPGEFKLYLPACCQYLSPSSWTNSGIYSLFISKARMRTLSSLDLQTAESVERQSVWTHSSSIEGQLLAHAKWEWWLRLTFAQVIMDYYNSHLTGFLCPWKPGCLMTRSERSECASGNLLLLPGSAVIPPVTQWQQRPSMALRHVSLLPLPSYSWSSPGDPLCFLSLGATKLDSGMLWGTSQSVPCTVWCAVTLWMCQSHRSSGWETEANIWMVVLKKQYKETARQGSPSARSHHLIAEIGWLCGFSVPASLQGSVNPTSLPACLTAC